MSKNIKFKGSPLTLVGRAVKVGMTAPDFKAIAPDLKDIGLSDFKGKIKVITSFPSLDTPVCDLQVKEFNKKAQGFSPEVVVLGISKDLPFAQQRFCLANDIKSMLVLSDYRYSSFGINYGLLIKELNLLARAVLILDKTDIIRYLEIVEELTSAPNYEKALKGLDEVIRTSGNNPQQELTSRCKPCEGGILPLAKDKVEKMLARHQGWQLVEDKKLVKEFKFRDFIEAKYFLDLVSLVAEEQGHHPILNLSYNRLKITLTTHAIGGLSENDFILAKIIDELQI